MPSLSDLPTEILIEIVGYYPQLIHGVPIADRFTVQNPLNAGPDGGVRTELFDGNNTLRALSQTSRALRGVFLPVLWARVHACFTKWNMPKGKVKRRAKMLERRMIGIQKTPYIVPYIHSLTVTLMECGMGNWQPIAQFIRVLTLLQNLRDLTVLRVPNDMVPVFDSSCRGKVFPSVQRLALDDHLAPILPSFPNIHTLTFPWSDQSANVLSSIKASCKRIHTLNHFRLSPQAVELLRDAIPNVRSLSLWNHNQLEKLYLLEGMGDLSELHIYYRPPPVFTYINNGQPQVLSQEVVAAAKRVLRTSKAAGRKKLCIHELTTDGFPKQTSSTVFGGDL